jgi:hypothetical protein
VLQWASVFLEYELRLSDANSPPPQKKNLTCATYTKKREKDQNIYPPKKYLYNRKLFVPSTPLLKSQKSFYYPYIVKANVYGPVDVLRPKNVRLNFFVAGHSF